MSGEQTYPTAEKIPAVDVLVRICLISLIAATCFLILRPFLPVIAWGIIISIATYPCYRALSTAIRGKQQMAAVIFTLVLLAGLIVPFSFMAGTLVEGIHSLVVHLQDGTLTIPPPPATVETWPVVGAPLSNIWSLASTNLGAALSRLAPQLKIFIPWLLSASAGLGSTVLQLLVSILLAGFLVATAPTNARVVRLTFYRIFGERGPEFEELTESTIRSVTNGIVGVALIQTLFASIGFLVVGLPAAGLWAMIFLVAAVLQVGILALIPAVILAFTTTSTGNATMFAIWCVVVGLMDNVLKPLLLGRGSKVPVAVIFLGVIGGFMAMGIIGLFLGAIILSVGYKLLLAWLEGEELSNAHR
ncbi:MAG TPA: AI-2E family transporter [Terriglobales bacterium]